MGIQTPSGTECLRHAVCAVFLYPSLLFCLRNTENARYPQGFIAENRSHVALATDEFGEEVLSELASLET